MRLSCLVELKISNYKDSETVFLIFNWGYNIGLSQSIWYTPEEKLCMEY